MTVLLVYTFILRMPTALACNVSFLKYEQMNDYLSSEKPKEIVFS